MSAPDPRAWLDQVDARTNAAEEGPWKVNDLRNAPDGNRDCIWVDVDNGRTYATVADMDEDEGLRAVWGLADAAFIASARTDLPAATTALRAVLDLANDADQVARQAAENNPEWADTHSTMAACIRAAITTALSQEDA